MSLTRKLISGALGLSKLNTLNVASQTAPFPLIQLAPGVMTRAGDLQVTNCYTNNVSVSTNTSFGSLMSSGGNLDFWIRAGQYDIVNELTLVLNVTNGGAAAVMFPPIPQIFNTIEIDVNEGNNVLSRFEGDYLYCLTSNFGNIEWAAKSTLMNTNQQWANNAVGLAAGASATYYMPLKYTALNQAKLNMRYIKNDIMVRFTFWPWATSGAGGAAAPTITSCSLILNQINLDITDQEAKAPLYVNVGNGVPDPIALRYLDRIRFYQGSVAMSPNTTYSWQLSNIRGMISHLYFFVRPAGATGFGLNNFQQIGWFDIVDNNNNTIIQYQQPSAFNLLEEYPDFWPDSPLSQNKNLYTYSFNLSPKDSYAFGSQNGFYPFTTYEQLVINTGSTLAAGNFDVVVFAVQYVNMTITDGKILPLNGV